MIRQVSAIEFRGTANSGRNQPLQILGETPGGELLELFMKPSGRPELGFEGMANELLATCVAGHLGLPVCEPLLVEMSPDWIETIPDATLQTVLHRSCPIAFGSLSAGPGWKIWSAEEQALGARRATALAIFAFDAFTGNDDRRAENAKHAGSGRCDTYHRPRALLPYTAKTLSSPFALGVGQSLQLGTCRATYFRPRAKRRSIPGFQRSEANWAGLSNGSLADYGALIPAQWAAAAEPIEAAIEHLKIVRDRIDECLDEVRRILT